MHCCGTAGSRHDPGGQHVNKGLVVMLATWLVFASPAGAQPMYVIDKLYLGVHEEKGRESTILELLPSGTAVEVLQRDGKLVQVKTPGNTVGWVDGDYLVKDKTNKAALAKLEARYQQAQQELQAAKRQVEELKKRRPPAIDEASRKELAQLRSENKELKETIASAEAQLSQLAQAQTKMEPVKAAESPPAVPELAMHYLKSPWMWGALGALAVLFILGFGLGVYLMDYLQRRRHGGFRL